MNDKSSMIAKIAQIFSTFDSSEPQSASTVARRTGIPLATTHRIMMELTAHRFLERDDTKRFSIGIGLWELGTRGSSKVSLRDIALPYMNDLQRLTQQHTQLAILDGTDVVYLAKLSARNSAVNITNVAERIPASICSPGLILAAFSSPEVKQKILEAPRKALTPRTVVDRDQLETLMSRAQQEELIEVSGWIHPDSTGISAPVRDSDGSVVAALCLILPADSPLVQTARSPLILASRAISRAIRMHALQGRKDGEASLRRAVQKITSDEQQ